MPQPKSGDNHTDIYYSRVDAVYIVLLENNRLVHAKRNKELIDLVMDMFEVNIRQAQYYISDAKKLFREIGREKREKAFKKVVRNLNLLELRSIKANDDKLLLETTKYYAKIFGLEVDEIKHTGEINLKKFDPSSLTDDQLKKLRTLLKQGIELKDALLSIGVIIQ